MAVDWDSLVVGPTTSIFGDQVEYRPAYGTSFMIVGVFDEAFIELTPLGPGGIDTESFGIGSPGGISEQMPVLGVQLSQFRTPPLQSDLLVIRSGAAAGRMFQVKEVRPDSHGGAELLLNEA